MKTKISSHYVFQHEHFSFPRNSGLPRSAFQEPVRIPWRALIPAAVTVGALIAIWAWT